MANNPFPPFVKCYQAFYHSSSRKKKKTNKPEASIDPSCIHLAAFFFSWENRVCSPSESSLSGTQHPILIMSWPLFFSLPRIQWLIIFWGSHVNELFRRGMMERENTERARPAFKGYVAHAHGGLRSCSCFMHLGWCLKYRRANSLASDELSFHLESQKAWNGGQSRRETCLIRTSFSDTVGNTTVLPKLGQLGDFDPSFPTGTNKHKIKWLLL